MCDRYYGVNFVLLHMYFHCYLLLSLICPPNIYLLLFYLGSISCIPSQHYGIACIIQSFLCVPYQSRILRIFLNMYFSPSSISFTIKSLIVMIFIPITCHTFLLFSHIFVYSMCYVWSMCHIFRPYTDYFFYKVQEV